MKTQMLYTLLMIIAIGFTSCNNKVRECDSKKIEKSLNDSIKHEISLIEFQRKRQDSLYHILDSLGHRVNWDSIRDRRRMDSIRRVNEFNL